jgi:RNA polymerase sigma factor (sigma-70 family)
VDASEQRVSGRPPGELEAEITDAYEKYSAELLRYAEAWTPDRSATMDAVQDVFLRYFIERSYGRRINNPRDWLYRVLREHLLDWGKAAAVTREAGSGGMERVADDRQNPERSLERTQLAKTIAATLSNRELECVRLRSQGCGYEEIGGLLGLRPGTVGALLHRAYKKLNPARRNRSMGVPGPISYLFLR